MSFVTGTVLSSDIKLLSMIVLLTCKNCEQEIDVTRCERVSLSGVVSIVSGHPDLHHLRNTLGVTSDNLDIRLSLVQVTECDCKNQEDPRFCVLLKENTC